MQGMLDRPLGETLDQRQKLLLMASLMCSMFLGALDQTIMSTATPHILADLGGFKLLSWLFTSYMLASTVCVPLVGKLSDMFGRKYFLAGGIVLFMTASALCGAAWSMPVLIGFRALQGIGGGIIFASVFATVGDLFPPSERAKYMGFFTGTFSLASIVGPTIGGLLTDHVGWRWVFYINVPVAVVALPAIWRNLPVRKSTLSRKIDFVGAFCLSVSTVALLLGLVWAHDAYGWGSAETVGLFAASAVFLGLFVAQETRHPEPIIPLGLFKNREFVVANMAVIAIGAGMFGAISYLPVFVQTSLRSSATASGLITTPQSMGLLITSIIGGQIIARSGRYRYVTILGATLVLTGSALLTTLGTGSPKWHVSAFMVIIGLGSGFVMPTMSVVIQNAVEHKYLGVATSARQFFMQIGQVLGTAVLGVVLAQTYHASFHDLVSNDAKAAIPPATLQQFDDPTLSLDKKTYGEVTQQVKNLPGVDGNALLNDTVHAQREALADAIRNVFIGSVIVAAFALLMTIIAKEVPLRRSFSAPSAEGAAAPQPIPIDVH